MRLKLKCLGLAFVVQIYMNTQKALYLFQQTNQTRSLAKKRPLHQATNLQAQQMILVLRLQNLTKAIVLLLILQFQIVKKKKILTFMMVIHLQAQVLMVDLQNLQTPQKRMFINYQIMFLIKKAPLQNRRLLQFKQLKKAKFYLAILLLFLEQGQSVY